MSVAGFLVLSPSAFRTCMSQHRFGAAAGRARGISVALGYPPVCCFVAELYAMPLANSTSGVGCGGFSSDLPFIPVGLSWLGVHRLFFGHFTSGLLACPFPLALTSALYVAGPCCAAVGILPSDFCGTEALFRKFPGPFQGFRQQRTECVRDKSVALGCPPVLLQPAIFQDGVSLSNVPWFLEWLTGVGAYLAAFFVTLQLYVLLILWRMLVTSVPGRSSPLALVLCFSCARRCQRVVLPLGVIGVTRKGCHTHRPKRNACVPHRNVPLGSRFFLLWLGFCHYPVGVWAAPKGWSEGISAVNEFVEHAASLAPESLGEGGWSLLGDSPIRGSVPRPAEDSLLAASDEAFSNDPGSVGPCTETAPTDEGVAVPPSCGPDTGHHAAPSAAEHCHILAFLAAPGYRLVRVEGDLSLPASTQWAG